MGGCRLDCRLSHTIAAFFGGFLALTTGIAGQQDNTASPSLPDINQLLSECGRIRSKLRFSDYKKFRVGTVTVTLKNKK
jgi:hypothetical protein